MASLEDVSAGPVLSCDRAIFTSLPSRTGEGYRLVAWSGPVRAEERAELTRRAPSHGALCGDPATARGVVVLRLRASGRAGWALVRTAGAEHTLRGGGRVWTDFLVAAPAEVARCGFHPADARASLAGAAPLKKPLGETPIPAVLVTRTSVRAAAERNEDEIARAAAIASLLLDPRTSVVAAGEGTADLLEDAMSMLPSSLRPDIDASAGLRFSPSRGVRVTLTDSIDDETIRATRGQAIECIDLATKMMPISPPLASWLSLMSRWWGEGRRSEADALADRLGRGWTVDRLKDVAAVCDAIDRRAMTPEALGDLLSSRSAA